MIVLRQVFVATRLHFRSEDLSCTKLLTALQIGTLGKLAYPVTFIWDYPSAFISVIDVFVAISHVVAVRGVLSAL